MNESPGPLMAHLHLRVRSEEKYVVQRSSRQSPVWGDVSLHDTREEAEAEKVTLVWRSPQNGEEFRIARVYQRSNHTAARDGFVPALDPSGKIPVQQLPGPTEQVHQLRDALRVAIEGLEKLARLGNGERRGNSLGNELAVKTLDKMDAVLNPSGKVENAGIQAGFSGPAPSEEI